jgi:2-polyprenyl-3-methyl-5-hydroxy-6-metoxy-1,4-benzoquinol methylase
MRARYVAGAAVIALAGMAYYWATRKPSAAAATTKDNPMASNTYMYADTSDMTEKQRLQALNDSHTPETMTLLAPLLAGCNNILEIGCGSGQLATRVAAAMDDDATLLATDREAAQVADTNAALSGCDRASAQKIDFMAEMEALSRYVADHGRFNLIYCRWVICHVPEKQQQAVLRSLFLLLAPGGTFVMDDCDNRDVRFTSSNPEKTALVKKATEQFTQFYDPIAMRNGLNLKRDAASAVSLLNAAGTSENMMHARLIGSYQVALDTPQRKAMVRRGKESSAKAFEDITGKSAEPFMATYRACEEDPEISGGFLGQHVTAITRKM